MARVFVVTVWDVITLQNCNFLTSRTRVSELLDTPEILHAVRGQSQRRRKVALSGGWWGSGLRAQHQHGQIVFVIQMT